MPYARKHDGPRIPALIADMNAADLVFTAFDGDIKDGGSPCSDDQYTAAIDRFDQLEAPAVYVPGDNEWTDCHRLDGGGYSNLERLDHLRRVMFAGNVIATVKMDGPLKFLTIRPAAFAHPEPRPLGPPA